jgi:hypothetical protein
MKRLVKIQRAYIQIVMLAMVLLAPSFFIAAPAFAATPSVRLVAAATACPTLGGESTATTSGNGEKCFVDSYVNPFVKLLAGLVGIFVVISIIIGGIQYSSSADDPSKVSAAKDRIRNAIIALIAYLFLLVFLKWLVPGGV